MQAGCWAAVREERDRATSSYRTRFAGEMDSESRDQPQTDFIYCNGAITELLKFGPCRLSSAHKLLFLVIPGNPGLVGFYRTFMQSLHSLLEYRHPVWAVSHAGHCDPPDSMDMTQDWSSEQDVFGLNGQVEHKLSFLRAQVPRDTGLVLVGHSIGCYIILDMMRRDPGLKVLKAVLLFPTIERMSASPQGQLMTPVLCHMRYAFYLPVFLLSLLPRSLLRVLASLVFSGVSCLDPCVVSPTVSLLTGDPAANAIYMGGQEMNQVLARDNVTIKQHLDKLVFYYGASDEWCPVQYYHDLKQDFPTGNIRLCEKGLRHAFVLDSGREVATMVLEWIRTDLHI